MLGEMLLRPVLPLFPLELCQVVLQSIVLDIEKIMWLLRVQVVPMRVEPPSPYHKSCLLFHSVQLLAEAAPDSTRGWWERRVEEGEKLPATLCRGTSLTIGQCHCLH